MNSNANWASVQDVELHPCLLDTGEEVQVGIIPRYTFSENNLWEAQAVVVYDFDGVAIIPIPVFTEWWWEWWCT